MTLVSEASAAPGSDAWEKAKALDESLQSMLDEDVSTFMPIMIVGHELYTNSNLPGLCQSIVASFDVSHLEKARNVQRVVQTRKLQVYLKLNGYDPGSIDGVFGHQTRAALRRFQKERGLSVSGEVDEPTRKALGLQSW